MSTIRRLEVDDVQKENSQGKDFLLVCAYDSDEKFRQNQLEGAISLSAFRSVESTLAKDREIVFYCA